jgi:hypothetical protein
MEERSGCANMTLIPALIIANIHWRHIIGQYSSNRAALVDPMSISRSEIDYGLYCSITISTTCLGFWGLFFPMPFL